MKRSLINQIITGSIKFVEESGFFLPPFYRWTADEWKLKDKKYDDIRDNNLGWDVSDYGSGDFYKLGIVAFTIRSAKRKVLQKYEKPFAEKILILEQGQKIPMHFHPKKVEDLINRFGADLFIRLYNVNADNSLNEQDPVEVLMDGCRLTINAGEVLRISQGESITLLPNHYHTFWAESGKVLLGEVTMTNNDHVFYGTPPNFEPIEEDCKPLYFLSNEYPTA